MSPPTRQVPRRTLRVLSYLFSRVRFLSALWFFVVRFNGKITIAYISKDAPELIAIAHAYYRRLGVTIRVFLDDRSSQQTHTYLRERAIPFECVSNPKDYVEPLYEKVSVLVDTEWLLNVTNDELLSVHSLVEVSLRVRLHRDIDCFAFPRAWIMVHDGTPYVGSAEFMGPDYQYRLVKHRSVAFHDAIHTPGFDVPTSTAHLTEYSRLYHFDWLLRSKADRQRKLDIYESKLPGARDRYMKWYLPEDYADDYQLQPLRDFATTDAISEYKQLVGVP